MTVYRKYTNHKWAEYVFEHLLSTHTRGKGIVTKEDFLLLMKATTKAGLGPGDWALVGSNSLILYGWLTRRPTADIDIAIPYEGWNNLRTILEDWNIPVSGPHEVPSRYGGRWYFIHLNRGRIDILIADWAETASYFMEGLSSPWISRPWNLTLPVMDPVYVIVSKLVARRDKDMEDILCTLLHMNAQDISLIRTAVMEFAPTELDEWEAFERIAVHPQTIRKTLSTILEDWNTNILPSIPSLFCDES